MTKPPPEFPGALYVDGWPSGERVALYVGAQFETHLGRLALPPGERWGLHEPRCTPVGGFKFAGWGHDAPGVWEWAADRSLGDRWRHIPGPFGGVIYDANGTLVTAPIGLPGGETSSAGYRYVADDGTIVLGQYTYGPDHGLHQWSETAGIRIGQGADGDLLTWDGQVHRVLATGPISFIRVHREGERVAVAYTVHGFGGVIQTLTLDELRALPIYSPPVVLPPVPLPPTPPAKPPQEPNVNPPTFDQWIRHEYPQVVAAWQYGHPDDQGRPNQGRPSDEWAAFQTLRRYSGFIPGMGESWDLPRMIAHERSFRPADTPAPSEPPHSPGSNDARRL